MHFAQPLSGALAVNGSSHLSLNAISTRPLPTPNAFPVQSVRGGQWSCTKRARWGGGEVGGGEMVVAVGFRA